MTQNQERHVLFLERNKLSWYVESTGEVFSVEISTDIMKDLEIVDHEKFKKLLASIVEKKQPSPGKIVLVVASSILFSFEISDDPAVDISDEIDKFSESIPFTNAYVKDISVGKQRFGVGLNRDLYEPLLTYFTQQNFEVTTLVPQILVQDYLSNGFTSESGASILGQVQKLEQQDFLEPDKKKSKFTITSTPEEGSSSKRAWILGVVFTLLLIVLGFFVYKMMKENEAVAPVVVPPSIEEVVESEDVIPEEIAEDSTATTAAEFIDNLVASESAEFLFDVPIVVLNGSAVAGYASEVKKILDDAGYKNVTADNYSGSEKSTVLLISSDVEPVVRASVLTVLKEADLSPQIRVVKGAQIPIQLILAEN